MEREAVLNRILVGDALARLRELPDESVHCCITSPPYWRLRDYNVDGQLGLETTPAEYVEKVVAVFREVRRVLRPDGTLWLILGDSYAGSGRGRNKDGRHNTNPAHKQATNRGAIHGVIGGLHGQRKGSKHGDQGHTRYAPPPPGLKEKDVIGIPWRLAFALQADGWWLRQDIVWHKPSAMPESVRDRCTRAHEFVFLLSKSKRYHFDQASIAEPVSERMLRSPHKMIFKSGRPDVGLPLGPGRSPSRRGAARKPDRPVEAAKTRNCRSVWTVAAQPFRGAHFATFPPKLVRRCVLAGCPKGGVVLDPFIGSGTVAVVARELGRSYVGIELNPEYASMAERRIAPELAQGRLA